MKPFCKHNIIFSLLLLSFSVVAQVPFQAEGTILFINNDTVNLSDLDFKIIPTVKVINANKSKGKLSDLRKGDYVGVTFTKIGKQEYVDTIYISDGPMLNESGAKNSSQNTRSAK